MPTSGRGKQMAIGAQYGLRPFVRRYYNHVTLNLRTKVVKVAEKNTKLYFAHDQDGKLRDIPNEEFNFEYCTSQTNGVPTKEKGEFFLTETDLVCSKRGTLCHIEAVDISLTF